ncbi:MAG TPA: DHHW family protein [Candidatus Avimonas sp.]|jgi:hypothetical protein|nr:hypothetical protein [Clostridiales bacterium]HQA15642.1 DHHW family protein [Candidatus Avimonas sp.]
MNKKAVSICFAILLFGVSITNLFAPKRDFSEYENRYLQQFPDLNAEDILSGKFSKDFVAFTSDQFIGRNGWISLKTISDLAVLKRDNGRVYFGKNGTLFDAGEKIDLEQLEKNMGFLADYITLLKSRLPQLNASILLVPTSSEILSEYLPPYAPVPEQQAAIDMVVEKLSKTASVYDPTKLLKENKVNYLYYRTDHHWTTDGAYLVYAGWAREIGLTPLSEQDFTIKKISSSFYGALHSKANLMTIKPDSVNVYCFTDDVQVLADFGGGDKRDSLYFEEFIQKKDVYSYFLGGNKPLVDIATNADNGKTIMVIKDSFANCFIPFLTKHYQRIIVADPRHLNTDYLELAEQSGITDLLVLYNVPNFSSDKNLSKLTANKKGG